jgi:hypothetical protein
MSMPSICFGLFLGFVAGVGATFGMYIMVHDQLMLAIKSKQCPLNGNKENEDGNSD